MPQRSRSGRSVGVRHRGTRTGAAGGVGFPLAPVALPFSDTFTRPDGSLGPPWIDLHQSLPTLNDRLGIRSNAVADVAHQDDNYGGPTVTTGWRGAAYVPTSISDNFEVVCNLTATSTSGGTTGGPAVLIDPASNDIGLGVWYNSAFNYVELATHGRGTNDFRYLDSNWCADLSSAYELRLRVVGGQAAAFLDGNLICGPVAVPAALAGNTNHGIFTDDLAGSSAETPTIADVSMATYSTALPTYTYPSISGASKIGTPTKYTSGSSVAVPYPSSVSAGDLLICYVANGSNRAWTVPAGWTSAWNGGFLIYAGCFWKVATGSESGTLSVSAAGAITEGAAVMIAVQGTSAVYPTQTNTTTTDAGVDLVFTNTTATATNQNLLGLNRMVLAMTYTSDDVAHTHPVAYTTIAETSAGGATCRMKLSGKVASINGTDTPYSTLGAEEFTVASSTNIVLSRLQVYPDTY